jgi:hypothetical protein
MTRRLIDAPSLLSLVDEVVGRGGRLETHIHGTSMWPTLADGDRVVLGPRRCSPGQLVLAVVDERPMLHRLVRVTGERALLRADSCQREDWVKLADLRADVYAIRRMKPRRLARAAWWLRAWRMRVRAVLRDQ